MLIAVIGAMDEEVELLSSSLENKIDSTIHHLSVCKGQLHGHEIALVKCGIGKVASAIATSILIDHFQPGLVINTGSAGGFDKNLNIGDIVVADHLIHHDVDVCHFGYELGQVPNMPTSYETDKQYSELAIKAAETLQCIKVKQGLICSGDSFIGREDQAESVKNKFPKMKAVEMEAASIAQVCHMMSTPCVVIRSLSDIAGKESPVTFEQYLEVAAKNSADLVMQLIKSI